MMTNWPRLLVVPAIALVFLSSGCTGADPTPTRTRPELPSEEQLAADSKPLPGSTLPGTKLKFGQEAVITVGVGPGRSLVGLTVTGVERGTAEDLEVVRASVPTVGDRPVGSLYFVKAVLENKDGRHFDSSYSGPLLRGTTESGEDAAALRLAFIEIGLLNCPMGHRLRPSSPPGVDGATTARSCSPRPPIRSRPSASRRRVGNRTSPGSECPRG